MPIIVTIKQHLDNLRALENLKPVEARVEVPNISHLAHDIGVKPTTLNRTVNNKFKSPNLNQIGAVIAALRRRGFQCDVGDVLRFVD